MTFRVEPAGDKKNPYFNWYQSAEEWLNDNADWLDNPYIRELMQIASVEVGGASFRGKPTKPAHYTDTLIIKVDPSKYKEFAVLVAKGKPDEFGEIAPDTFRMWWD